MSTTRNVVLVVGGGLVAAWLAATIGGVGGPSSPHVVTAAPADGVKAPAASSLEVARLSTDQQSAGASRPLRRNLFQFTRAERPQAQAAAEDVVSAFVSAAATLLSPPPPPEWRLIGIAEDTTPNGAARTAIISGANDVFVVKEGAKFSGTFEVVRIQRETVELRGLKDGSLLTLSLKPR